MMADYATLFAFAIVGVLFGLSALIGSFLFRPDVPEAVKRSTYECGMDAIGSTEIKTNIRFYVYALLFVIFDVETLFVFPWAVVVKKIGGVALIEMMIFLSILFLGLVYAWSKCALAWDVPNKAGKEGAF